jgi:hypothetical protein
MNTDIEKNGLILLSNGDTRGFASARLIASLSRSQR